jgi:hypothetical protein
MATKATARASYVCDGDNNTLANVAGAGINWSFGSVLHRGSYS